MVHAIGMRDRPFLVEEERKWIFPLLHVLFAFEPAVDLLGSYK